MRHTSTTTTSRRRRASGPEHPPCCVAPAVTKCRPRSGRMPHDCGVMPLSAGTSRGRAPPRTPGVARMNKGQAGESPLCRPGRIDSYRRPLVLPGLFRPGSPRRSRAARLGWCFPLHLFLPFLPAGQPLSWPGPGREAGNVLVDGGAADAEQPGEEETVLSGRVSRSRACRICSAVMAGGRPRRRPRAASSPARVPSTISTRRTPPARRRHGRPAGRRAWWCPEPHAGS